jgi:hypothetical protein
MGRLVRVDRKAGMGRNPATGETIKIAAKKVVKFRIAKAAKDAIVPARSKKAMPASKSRCWRAPGGSFVTAAKLQ